MKLSPKENALFMSGFTGGAGIGLLVLLIILDKGVDVVIPTVIIMSATMFVTAYINYSRFKKSK